MFDNSSNQQADHHTPRIKLKNSTSIFILLFIQLCLCAPGLLYPGLWLDEAYSALLARMSISEIFEVLQFDAGPPLYYLLIKFWKNIFGQSEIALRAFSYLCSAGTTALLFSFIQKQFNNKSAWIITLIWIFFPISVHYTHEVRNYSLIALQTMGLIYLLPYFAQRPMKNGLYILGVLICTSLVYTHNMGWFILCAYFVVSLFWLGFRRGIIISTILGLCTIFLYLPWVPILLKQLNNTHMTIAWVQQMWSPLSLLHTGFIFLPGGSPPPYLDIPAFPETVQWINVSFAFALLVLAIYTSICQRNVIIQSLIIFTFAGILFPYVYSFVATPIYLPGRTDFAFFPFFCILLGYGIVYIPGKYVSYIIVYIFVLQSLLIVISQYNQERPTTAREIVKYHLSRQVKENDVFLCTGLSRPELEYYGKPFGFQFVSYPLDMEKHLAHINEQWYINNKILKQEANQSISACLDKMKPGSTLWLVGSYRSVNKPLYDALRERSQFFPTRPANPNYYLLVLQEPIYLLRFSYGNLSQNP